MRLLYAWSRRANRAHLTLAPGIDALILVELLLLFALFAALAAQLVVLVVPGMTLGSLVKQKKILA
jgi:hypothetical protein